MSDLTRFKQLDVNFILTRVNWSVFQSIKIWLHDVFIDTPLMGFLNDNLPCLIHQGDCDCLSIVCCIKRLLITTLSVDIPSLFTALFPCYIHSLILSQSPCVKKKSPL